MRRAVQHRIQPLKIFIILIFENIESQQKNNHFRSRMYWCCIVQPDIKPKK